MGLTTLPEYMNRLPVDLAAAAAAALAAPADDPCQEHRKAASSWPAVTAALRMNRLGIRLDGEDAAAGGVVIDRVE